VTRLPGSVDELRGLRARRYVRVSSEEQGEKYGPEAQDDRLLAAIARLGLVDAGPAFVDEHSAWARSDQRPALRELVAAAQAGAYDLLLVPYFSRWSRDTEVALRLRRELHAAGVVLWFAQERFLSSDADAHERFLDEAVGAEKYSHRLSRTISSTFESKFERYGDQAGSPGLGFRRTPQPEARLEIDPGTMPRAIALFERYARGDISYRELGRETGVAEQAIRGILINQLYNGWAVRHRRSDRARRVASPWRKDPPVSDELWARVAEVRTQRLKNGGSPRARRTYLLAKRLWCECGRSIAADSAQRKDGSVARRYRHEDCPLGGQSTFMAERFEDVIAAQLTGFRLDGPAIADLRALAAAPARIDTSLRRKQLEAELRDRASAHAARRLTTEAYLAEHARITTAIDQLGSASTAAQPAADIDRMIAWLRALKVAWRRASLEAQAGIVAQVYRRVVVRAGEVVRVELTDAARAMGMASLLPRDMELARPAGAGRTRPISVHVDIDGDEAQSQARTA